MRCGVARLDTDKPWSSHGRPPLVVFIVLLCCLLCLMPVGDDCEKEGRPHRIGRLRRHLTTHNDDRWDEWPREFRIAPNMATWCLGLAGKLNVSGRCHCPRLREDISDGQGRNSRRGHRCPRRSSGSVLGVRCSHHWTQLGYTQASISVSVRVARVEWSSTDPSCSSEVTAMAAHRPSRPGAGNRLDSRTNHDGHVAGADRWQHRSWIGNGSPPRP